MLQVLVLRSVLRLSPEHLNPLRRSAKASKIFPRKKCYLFLRHGPTFSIAMNKDERSEMFAKRLLALGIDLSAAGGEAALPTREENARWLAEKILRTFELERGREMEAA